MTLYENAIISGYSSEDHYRQRFSWEKVTWSSHCGNCIANCTYRLYSRDSKSVFEEQSGVLKGFDGIPDMNPLGCQKGSVWQKQRDSKDRITKPLRRVGERGSAQWEEISLEEALRTVAEHVVEAIETEGPESIILESGAECGVLASMARSRLSRGISSIYLDANASVSDIHAGHWLTFGNLLGGSSADDTFRAQLIIIWNGNPAFTRIPYYHYLTEARYHGAKVVVIAPDYSPATMHADLFVPIKPGTDAALMLGIAKELIDTKRIDREFLISQTDMPLLVKVSDRRFLRESDLKEGGREDKFYVSKAGALCEVKLGQLDPIGSSPDIDLSGELEVTLKDGTHVETVSVFNILRSKLEEYTKENVAKICGLSEDIIETLANWIYALKTKVSNGLGSCKHYHGDLMERSLDLVLAMTGNFGKPGTGLDTYIIALLEGEVLAMFKDGAGATAGDKAIETVEMFLESLYDSDEAMTRGKAFTELMRIGATIQGGVPPALFYYHHCGFKDEWEKDMSGDAPKPLSQMFEESLEQWGVLDKPKVGVTPKVMIQAGTNILRRTRGGQRNLLNSLWPKLDLIVTVDFRMNTAGMFSDIFLPIAVEGERVELHAANSHAFDRMFSDKAFEPVDGVLSEFELFNRLSKEIAKVASERGVTEFVGFDGNIRTYEHLTKQITHLNSGGEEYALDEVIRDSVLTGNLPPYTNFETLREKGLVSPVKLPQAMSLIGGGSISSTEPFVAYKIHTEENVPYETLTGRAQFYMDHPWFIDANEELPCHKEPPDIGGNFEFQITGGHPRWSIHATNTTNTTMLETTRGRPVVHINDRDALELGIEDANNVRVFNDFGELELMARVTSAVRPKQLIIYASFEPHLFANWKDATFVEPGIVKWLHLIQGYGHLIYTPMQWQPTQSDRLFKVGVEKVVKSY